MLREVPYGWGGDPTSPKSGVAVYQLQEDRCVFSGITRSSTSTINDAEGIIKAIVASEGIDPRRVSFFDLRTSWGYNSLRVWQHELLKLTIEHEEGSGLTVTRWEAAEADPNSLRPFLPYITTPHSVH